MLEGETIKVGGEDKIVPPLNWKGCKKFYGIIASGGLNSEAGADAMSGLIFAALVRNYPELTQDQMEDMMTPGEVMAALPVVLRISGFVAGETPGGSAKSRTGKA
jgi:hypothetical protein